jgi:hypothetical protein
MMKISVEGIAPFAKPEIIKIIEDIESPKLTYLHDEKVAITTLVFEVEIEDVDEVLMLVKKAIRATELGKMLAFRVIPAGTILYIK